MHTPRTRAAVANRGLRSHGKRAFLSSDRPKIGGPNLRNERKDDAPPPAKGAYLRSLKYALGLIWSVRPGYVILSFLKILWSVPARALDVWIIQFVVNTATATGDVGAIALACAGYLAFMLAKHAFTSYVERDYNVAAEDRIRADIQLRLHEKARAIDLAAFDRKEFYDDYARALDVLDERVIKCFKDLVNVLEYGASILTLGGVMAAMDPVLVLIVAAGSLASVWTYTRRARIEVERNRAITPLMRRFQYLNDLYYQRIYAKDVRVERIDEIASADHRASADALDAEDRKWGLRSAAFQFAGLGAGAITDAGMYLYLAWCIVAGRIDAGNFMALWNAAWQFSSCLRTLFRAIPELGETCLLIADAQGFERHGAEIADPPAGEERPLGEVRELAMENVSFSYEPTRPVLSDVSFSVRRGQTLAIVGHNGAGKSTLVKLLLRLYDPNEGRVLLDGAPYGAYRAADIRSSVAVVFQDYQHYAYSVAENVLMRPCEGEADRERVRRALAQVGLLEKVERFEQGIDTHVTKEFSAEGALFSGGELQKLAIARALAKDAPIVVFDEPSSALDPLAEREVLDLMQSLFADRICVVISHRLSMTRDADRILVVDGGRIAEEGTHVALIARQGLYASMWEAQAGKYADAA